MKFLQVLDRFFSRFEKFVVSGSILLISASVMINVICRQLQIVFVGTEEVCEFCIVWLTFLGTALCARQGTHISMSALLNKFPKQQKKIAIIIISAVTGLFSLFLAYLGLQLTQAVLSRGQVSPTLRVPIWYIYMATPIGFLLTGFYYLRAVMRNLKEEGLYLGAEDVEEIL